MKYQLQRMELVPLLIKTFVLNNALNYVKEFYKDRNYITSNLYEKIFKNTKMDMEKLQLCTCSDPSLLTPLWIRNI